MKYLEVKDNLFNYYDKGYYLAHCISADFKLGAGIAKEFDNRYDVRKTLFKSFRQKWYLKFEEQYQNGYAILCIDDRIINLVTKSRYWQKPTLQSIKGALNKMSILCANFNIKKVAMPKIGCGLDKLNWSDVSKIIQNTFKDIDIEIIVCYL